MDQWSHQGDIIVINQLLTIVSTCPETFKISFNTYLQLHNNKVYTCKHLLWQTDLAPPISMHIIGEPLHNAYHLYHIQYTSCIHKHSLGGCSNSQCCGLLFITYTLHGWWYKHLRWIIKWHLATCIMQLPALLPVDDHDYLHLCMYVASYVLTDIATVVPHWMLAASYSSH